MTVMDVYREYGTTDVDYYRDGKYIKRSDAKLSDEVLRVEMGDDDCWHVHIASNED